MPTDPSTATSGAKPSRRTFLTGAALTGVAVGAGALASGSASAAPALAVPAAARSLATCGLELDGAAAGGLQSVSGGGLAGKVFVSKKGKVRQKSVVDITLEDFTFTAGTGMSKAFYQAIAGTVKDRGKFHKGRITTRNGDGSVTGARQFHLGVITEIAFPTLDASDTDAALMTVKLSPQGGVDFDANAGPLQQTPSTESWRRNNYRLQIDGIDCSQVSRIDGLVVREPVSPPAGPSTGPTYGPTRYSSLVITMPQSSASSLNKWGKSALLDDHRANRTGQLEYLSDTAGVLFRLKLFGLGIFGIEPSKVSADADDLQQVTASIFCERMTFSWDKVVVG